MGNTRKINKEIHSDATACLNQKVGEIREILNKLSLYDSLEVLANVFILEGLDFMDSPSHQEVSKLTVFNIVSEDIKNKGSTLANSCAMLGIDVLASLSKE